MSSEDTETVSSTQQAVHKHAPILAVPRVMGRQWVGARHSVGPHIWGKWRLCYSLEAVCDQAWFAGLVLISRPKTSERSQRQAQLQCPLALGDEWDRNRDEGHRSPTFLPGVPSVKSNFRQVLER